MSLPAFVDHGQPAEFPAPVTPPVTGAVTGAVALSGISRTFARPGGVIQALHAVSATIPTGRITALVGPDGAGKTTLLRIVAGLLLPDSGTAAVLGRDVVKDPAAVQAAIG